jgi:tetratricopeptide (TPR) repeat protein
MVVFIGGCFYEYYIEDEEISPVEPSNNEEYFGPQTYSQYVSHSAFLESIRLMEIGKSLLLEGREIESVQYFKGSIGYYYFNPFAHFFLGTAYFRLGWWESAILEFSISNDINNNIYWNSIVDTALGLTYENMKLERVSEIKYEKAYKTYPKNNFAKSAMLRIQQTMEEEEQVESEGKIESIDKGEEKVEVGREEEVEKEVELEREVEEKLDIEKERFFKEETEYDKRDFEDIETIFQKYFKSQN